MILVDAGVRDELYEGAKKDYAVHVVNRDCKEQIQYTNNGEHDLVICLDNYYIENLELLLECLKGQIKVLKLTKVNKNYYVRTDLCLGDAYHLFGAIQRII